MKVRIERWRLAKGQVNAALLTLDPIEDAEAVLVAVALVQKLDKRIASAGGVV